nr:response regulator [Saprospiraceae bacterium]
MFIESSIPTIPNWRSLFIHSILLVFLCSVCMGWPSHQLVGQNGYPFQFFGQEEGLSSASVRTLLQDEQGFLWVGSDNGLDRFDGRGFLNFRFDPEDPNSLTSNRVNGLSLDAQQRLWIGTSNGLCYLDLKSGVIKRVAITGSAVGPVPYDIKALLVDRNGSIWVGTLSNGLFKLSPKGGGADYDKQQFLPDPTDSNSLAHSSVTYLFQQDTDHLWISTSGGICRLHVESGIFTPRVDTALLKVDQGIRSLTADENGHIVFPLADVGIYHIDPSEIPLIPRPYLEFDLLGASGQAEMYLSAIQDRKGQLWVGTDRGVFLVDPDKQKYRSIDQAHLVRCFLEGQDGIMWAGFGRAGIGREDRMMDPYRYYQHDPQNPNSVSPGQVRTMTEDRQGNLWVGYLYEGLDQFSWDERKQEFINLQRIRHKPNQIGGLASNAIIEIFPDSKGFLWIATNGDGLNKLDPVTGKMETYLHDPDNPTSLSGNRIWGLSEDRNGYIWVGEFTTGLNRLDPTTGVVKRFQHQSDNPNSLSHNRIKSMFMDSEGNLWIGTNGGLNRLDVETEQFARYLHSTVDSTTLSGNVIFSIYEDASQNLWVGTTLGLNKLTAVIGQEKRSTPHIERIYESSGLPSNSILGIQGDGQGKLWISTDNGVAKLIESGAESRFVVINNHDGLEYAQFLNKAHYYSKKREEFYFGSRQGLLVLPNQQNDRKVLPSQLLVSTVSKQTMDSRGGKKWSNPFINIKEVWNLNHRDRIISIKLSDFNWDKNRRYEYLLKGFDDNWLELPENMELTYTNLEAGKYTLFARLLSDDPASHAEVQLLQIRMSPPWRQTIWAYSLYLIAILAGVYGFYQFQWQQELKRQETENLRALDRFKNQLYTNITHEFKTPLTVISGMIEQVSGHDKVKRVVRRNSKNLLDLVNQILDLRKLELGKVRLDWVQADVVLYCQYVLESYEALADIKGVSLHFIPRQRGMLMDIDKEKLLRILSNLLSNAIKFTPAGGNVYLSLEEVRLQQAEKEVVPWLKFAVKDTGVGIPMEDQAFIFDRFYQVETDELRSKGEQKEKYRYRGPGGGNGIGLALTKDLVHFMDGRIELESEEGKGTTFTVWLPVKQTAVKEEVEELNIPIPDLSQAEMESLAEIEATPSTALNGVGLQVLVVEDNRDVRHYLVTLLQGQYQVFIAKDGQEGADKAFELIPDIIISDVMMPKKDGFELCR